MLGGGCKQTAWNLGSAASGVRLSDEVVGESRRLEFVLSVCPIRGMGKKHTNLYFFPPKHLKGITNSKRLSETQFQNIGTLSEKSILGSADVLILPS